MQNKEEKIQIENGSFIQISKMLFEKIKKTP